MIVTFFCYDHENFVTKKRRCGVSKYTESFGKWFNPFDEKLGQASKVEAIQYAFEYQQSKINEIFERLKECEENLAFYADFENWQSSRSQGRVAIKLHDVSMGKECIKSGGKRAREYFKKYEDKK